MAINISEAYAAVEECLAAGRLVVTKDPVMHSDPTSPREFSPGMLQGRRRAQRETGMVVIQLFAGGSVSMPFKKAEYAASTINDCFRKLVEGAFKPAAERLVKAVSATDISELKGILDFLSRYAEALKFRVIVERVKDSGRILPDCSGVVRLEPQDFISQVALNNTADEMVSAANKCLASAIGDERDALAGKLKRLLEA